MSDEREQEAKSGGPGNNCSESAPPPSQSQPLADRLECPICMIILPLRADGSFYMACCGKMVCQGCIYANMRARAKRARAKPDSELVELVSQPCAFCRAKPPEDDREILSRIRHQVDSHDDLNAMCVMGDYYREGSMGLPKSRKKAMEMFKRAYELGSPEAAYILGNEYDPRIAGAEGDINKAREYTEEAARLGLLEARYRLGRLENEACNNEAAAQHFINAACAGHDEALDAVKECYRCGLVTKDDFANALRTHQAAQDEVKSDARELAKHLKQLCNSKRIDSGF